MPFPPDIPTRVVSVGGTAVLESARLLRTVVEIKSSKSLIRQDTGYRFESHPVADASAEGSEVSFVLPCTDAAGWKDAATGSIIDVSAEGSYTHRYTAKVSFQDEQGRKFAGTYTIGPFVLPSGDGPVDLDKMVPASSTAGEAIAFPDWISRVVADAQQAAVDASNALVDSEAFVDTTAAAKIADPTSATGAAVGSQIRRRARLADGVFSAVDGALEDGRSATVQVQSDSTGNAPDEWVYGLSSWLGARHPQAHVKYKLWSDPRQDYDTWVTFQDGSAGERHIPFNGTTTRSMFQPRAAIPHIGGDIDLRVRLSMDDWTPSVAGCILARYAGAGARGWRLNINSGGAIDFAYTTDGTTNIQKVSSATGHADGSQAWIRVTLDVDNGQGGHTWKAYKSADGVTWVEIGSSVTTTGGPIAIFDANTEYEVGGRGFVGEPWAGKVYEVQIRDGIDGKIVNPQPIDSWVPRAASGSYVPGYFAGSPTLYVLNGSHPGAATTYFADAARHPKMVHPYAGSLLFQSCCHNDGENIGAAYLAARDAWLALSDSRAPGSQGVLVTQNPEVAPAAAHMVAQHSRRRVLLMTWAARRGLAVVDTYKAFTDYPGGAATLMQPDGVHPTVSSGTGTAGMDVWLRAVTDAWDAL